MYVCIDSKIIINWIKDLNEYGLGEGLFFFFFYQINQLKLMVCIEKFNGFCNE